MNYHSIYTWLKIFDFIHIQSFQNQGGFSEWYFWPPYLSSVHSISDRLTVSMISITLKTCLNESHYSNSLLRTSKNQKISPVNVASSFSFRNFTILNLKHEGGSSIIKYLMFNVKNSYVMFYWKIKSFARIRIKFRNRK